MSAAILLAGGGLVTLALAWRRRYRGERSGVLLTGRSTTQTIASVAVVPIVGIAGTLAGLLIAGLLDGHLRAF
jgi:hypothetical protein